MALQIATNPQTGESVVLVGGEWKPVAQTAANEAGAKAYLVGNEWVVDDTAPAPKAKVTPTETPAATDAMGADFGSAIMSAAAPREKKTYTGSVFDTQPFNPPFDPEEAARLSRKGYAEQTTRPPRRPPQEMRATPEAQTRDRTGTELYKDTTLGIFQGGVGLLKGITDNIAAGNNPASEGLGAIDLGLERLKTPQLRGSAIARQGLIERARETQGELAATRAAFTTMFTPAGADIVAKGAGSMIPTLGMSLANLGVKSMAMANALSNSGDAANQTAEQLRRLKPEEWSNNEVYQTLREKGLSHRDAVNMLVPLYVVPAQTVGFGTGYLSGRTGLEKGLAGKAQGTALGRGAAELLGEEAETLAPQLVGNITAGAIDQRTSPIAGLGQAAIETAAGAGPGSLLSAAAKGAPAPPPVAPAIRPETVPTPPAAQQEQPAPAVEEARIEPTLDNEALVAEAAKPAEETPAPVAAARQKKIATLAERIASRGVDPEEALRVAKLQVASDEKKKLAAEEAAAAELPTYYPQDKTREAEIFRELVDQGVPPEQARAMAKEQLAAEKEDRKIAAAQSRYLKKAKKDAGTAAVTEGTEDAGQPIAEAGGVGPELVEQPDQEQPAGGTAGPATDGMVPAGENVVPAPQGEAVEPVAVEGVPVGTETTEAVQAEAQGQEPAPIPAAEVTPKGKRGRKPLAPELKAVSEQKRQQQKLDANAAARNVSKAEQLLREDSEPINEEDYDTDEAVNTAQEEQRRRRNATVRTLYEISQTNKNKPGQRAAEVLKELATPKELADAKAAYEFRKKQGSVPSAQNQPSGAPADPAFNKITNGAQAISHIVKTGDEFQQFLAKRLRAFVANVKIVVVEKGNEPAELSTEKNRKFWSNASGLYVQNDATGARTVYLAGESYGELQGVNVVTVLHELLHAATNQKLYLGIKANQNGFSTNAPLTKAVADLEAVMHRVQDRFIELNQQGKLPPEIYDLVKSTKGTVITDVREFLAYGMSDPDFQKFLMTAEGAEEDVSFFSKFVNSIRKFFNMGEDTVNALSDLIVVTDRLLSARKTADMRLLEKGDRELAQRGERELQVSPQTKPGALSKTGQVDLRTAKEVERDVDIAVNQVAESRTAEELAKSTSALQLATDPKKLAGAARRAYDAASYESKRVLLNGVTTDFLVEMGSQEIPELTNTYRFIQEMHGMTARLMEGATDPSTVLFNVVKNEPDMMQPLYDVALESTLAEIDPSTDRRSKKLNDKFDSLSDKAKHAYGAIRDYFTDMAAMYSTLLDDQVNELGASAEDKANLMAKLKTIYEVGGNIVPYFSLVRRGNFWLRVAGKGKDRQFYMFRSMQERDKVAEELAAKRRSTVEELRSDNDFEIGNDIRSLRLDSYDNSAPKLTAVMDAVDGMKLAGATAEEVAEAKNRLKDAIYQMYLMSMPDQSFRKKFISREGVTGFTTDLLQNFSDTATAMSVQLSRIKYGRKIRNSLLAARKSITNRPELLPYTEEMGTRVALELPTNYDESKVGNYMDAAANFGTRAAFLYYLSGVSSALLQPISVFQFALPLLGARHGYGTALAEFTKLLAVWNAYGVSHKNSDGSTTYIMPTLRNSKAVTLDPVEKRAMDHMIGRNIGQVTLAGELMARRNVPTEKTVSTTRRVAKATWWGATGALMQTAERLAQEAVYLTSFRSSRRNAKEKLRKSNAYLKLNAADKTQAMADFEKKNFQRWVDQAVVDTHESLGNMTSENRPPIMRNPAGKLALQFNMFPLHNYIMLGKNGMKMIGLMPAKDRAEATKTLFGQLGMTYLLAGAVGVPGVYTMIGFLSGMFRDNRDKLPADLREMDFQTWFRQKFLPEQLGNEWAKLVDRGVLNYATGADFSSRLSLSNMWFREGKEVKTEREGLAQWLTDHMGATVSQALTYADAMDAFKKGDYRTGVEKIAPAFVRNWMFMQKQKAEGAKDSKGAQLLSKDAITTGELIWRAVGFNSDQLADIQTTNFKVIGMAQRIDNQRGSLLQRLDLHYRNNDMREYKKTFDAIKEFNTKYPWEGVRIEPDDIANSLEKKAEQRGQSWRGVGVTEKNAPYAVEALAKSRVEATQKERKAREK